MVIELRVVQFWSEIILVISNRTRAARSFDFEITRMISDQIALHSVQLPLLINFIPFGLLRNRFIKNAIRSNVLINRFEILPSRSNDSENRLNAFESRFNALTSPFDFFP